MPQSLNILLNTSGGLPQPLFLLEGPVKTQRIRFASAGLKKKGLMVAAADLADATQWTPVIAGTPPAATDLVVVLLEDQTPSAAGDIGSGAIMGTFSEDFVFGTSSGATVNGVFTAPQIATFKELLLRQQIHFQNPV